MTATAVSVLIVGAGQAGLSLSWHLTARGIDHVLIERDSIGHEWRDGRWNNFTLVTPNWQCQLPGFAYDGDDPDGFMKRDEVLAFLQRYAASFSPPVREGVEVVSLTQSESAGYLVETTGGVYEAASVVIATGGYHHPVIPALAAHIDPGIRQLHSSQYREAAELPAGGVLVVGSGQSGAQIAEDLFLDGREVHLALGGAPRVARFYRGRDCVAWLNDMGVYDVPVSQHAGGLSKRESTNHYVTGRDGGRDIDLRQFAVDGMHLYGRLAGIDIAGGTGGARGTSGSGAAGGSRLSFAPTLEASLDAADAVSESIKNDIDAYIERTGIDAPTEARKAPVWRPAAEPETLDLRAEGVGSIIWSIGYRADYRWVKVGVFDGLGHPTHHRGVTAAEGLYFLGLPWLHTWGSGRFAAIARDSEYLADAIEQRALVEHSVAEATA